MSALRFASGKYAHGFCDCCGFRYDLWELKEIFVKSKATGALYCPTCWDPDHPQLQVGLYPINDPQALRRPRPDNGLSASRGMYVPITGVGVSFELGILAIEISGGPVLVPSLDFSQIINSQYIPLVML